MLRSWKRLIEDESGATAVVVALSAAMLVSVAALAIDLGMLLNSRAQAQRAADSAALAGASAFILPPTPPLIPAGQMPDSARVWAERYAGFNEVARAAVRPEDTQVTLDMSQNGPPRVTVSITRSDIGTWFAAIFGVNSMNVGARATAAPFASGSATCLKPFGVMDGWHDANGNGRYDPGELYSAGITGWGTSYRNNDGSGHVNDIGRSIQIKRGVAGTASQTGWYFLLRIDENTGGNDVRQTIANPECNQRVASVGDRLPGEWGNTVGPVLQGVEDLIKLDPDARWQGGRIVGSKFGVNGNGEGSPRIITVPLLSPVEAVADKQRDFGILNFASLFIEAVDQTGPAADRTIYGRWMRVTRVIPDNCWQRNTCLPHLQYLRLVN